MFKLFSWTNIRMNIHFMIFTLRGKTGCLSESTQIAVANPSLTQEAKHTILRKVFLRILRPESSEIIRSHLVKWKSFRRTGTTVTEKLADSGELKWGLGGWRDGKGHANYFYQLHFFFKRGKKKKTKNMREKREKKKKGLREKGWERKLETGIKWCHKSFGEVNSPVGPLCKGLCPTQNVRSVFSLRKRSK